MSGLMFDAIKKRRQELSGDLPMEDGDAMRNENQELEDTGLAPTVKPQGSSQMSQELPRGTENEERAVMMDSNADQLNAQREMAQPDSLGEEKMMQEEGLEQGPSLFAKNLYEEDNLKKPGLAGKLARRMQPDMDKQKKQY